MLINPLSMCCQHDIMMEMVTVRNFVNVFSYDLVSHWMRIKGFLYTSRVLIPDEAACLTLIKTFWIILSR